MLESLKEGWAEASRLHTGRWTRGALALAWATVFKDSDRAEVRARTDEVLAENPELSIVQEINAVKANNLKLRVDTLRMGFEIAKVRVETLALRAEGEVLKVWNYLMGRNL